MTQHRDWQKDMEMCEKVKDSEWLILDHNSAAYWQRGGLMSTIWEGVDAEALQQHKAALPYWLQEAKERGDREQRLKEAMNQIIIEYDNPHNETGIKAAYKMRRIAEEILSTLYPDTPAQLPEKMRDFTPEEAEAYEASLNRLSKPTGRNLFDTTPAPKEGE